MLTLRYLLAHPHIILHQMKECALLLTLTQETSYVHAMDALDLAIALLSKACDETSNTPTGHNEKELAP